VTRDRPGEFLVLPDFEVRCDILIFASEANYGSARLIYWMYNLQNFARHWVDDAYGAE
jgi:hypothetical protein